MSPTLNDDEIREAFATLCEESIKTFSKPCRTCHVDIDLVSKKRVANPEKPFTMALVAYVSPDGAFEASTAYLTPVTDLSSTNNKTLNFEYGKDRVSSM